MSEALRLADALDALMDEESLVGAVTIDRAAAELRRLHAENEAMRAELVEQARVNGMGGEREARLMAVNAELVEALRCADAMLSAANMDAKAVERKVTAALTKVEVSK